MSYKNIFISIIILTVIATLFISVKQPKMHKVTLIYDSNYTIKQIETPKKEEVSIPTITQEEQVKTVQKRLQNNVEKETLSNPTIFTTVKKQAPNTKKTVSNTSQNIKQPVIKKEVKKETLKSEQKIKTDIPKVQPKTETIVKPNAVNTVKVVQKEEPKKQTLTKEQEEIAWNIWRSNIQNQIMKDTSLPTIPNGTIFRFTFDVDKFGKVSNIQTYSDTRAYTPYAIQYIAPVIRSYQGKSILNFPKGTNRVTTTVKGAWKISNNTRYSTPNDYNDTEIIHRIKN